MTNKERIANKYLKINTLLLKALSEIEKLSVMASNATGRDVKAVITNGLDIEFLSCDNIDGLKSSEELSIEDILKLI